jgi:hypothetical protein
MKPSEPDANTTRSRRKPGWSPAPWNALEQKLAAQRQAEQDLLAAQNPQASPDHRGRTGMAVPPRRRHPGGVPRIRHGARGFVDAVHRKTEV